MNSLTLLELLRRRSALPVEETCRLLDELPALLDDAERQGDLPTARLLSAVRVLFESDTQPDCAGRPVSEWPAFHLDLIVDETQGETAGQVDSPDADAPARFAALLYELVGGPHRGDGARPPLAALGEPANRILQRALAGGGFASCVEFWREFLRESGRTLHALRIASRLTGSGTRGEVLRLIPRDVSAPVRLVARSPFRIGRSVAEADLVTRLLPKTPENDKLTHQLGRVHVCGEIIGGEPTLRDGNGTGSSANGSTFDAHPLDANLPRPVRQRGVLDLAGRFAFQVIPHAAQEDFVIENLPMLSGAAQSGFGSAIRKSPLGAIVFAACAEQPFVRDAVWLFTRVDFDLGKNDGPVWLPPSRNNPASFLRIGGCFWIVNAALPAGKVRLDKAALAPGEAAPLGAGAVLRLNAREFAIEVT